jgi:hypothetical protein
MFDEQPGKCNFKISKNSKKGNGVVKNSISAKILLAIVRNGKQLEQVNAEIPNSKPNFYHYSVSNNKCLEERPAKDTLLAALRLVDDLSFMVTQKFADVSSTFSTWINFAITEAIFEKIKVRGTIPQVI